MLTKLSSGFIIILLASTLIIHSIPQVISQTDYTEEISTTIIGNTAFWEIKLKGNNISILGLDEIEKDFDNISSYQLLTLDSSKWIPEDEFFSSSGYNLLGFDVIPTSEVFLKVVSNNLQDAEKLADSFSQFFHLRFIIFSSSNNEYIFYSHMVFNLIQEKMWDAVPVEYGGAATLIDKELFMYRDVPIFKFSGEKGSNGFIHSVTLGGLQHNVIIQQTFSLNSIFTGINNTKISSEASSSIISINFINGFISYSGEGEVTNFPNNQSAKVVLHLEPTDNFPSISIDVTQNFPSIIAIRDVDKANLNQGDIVTIGIRIKNISPIGSTPISYISINDNWWNSIDMLEFVDGETNRTLGHLAPQSEFTLAYHLRVISSEKEEIIIPQNEISYLYKIQNKEVQNIASFNKLSLVLNGIKPVIDITASIDSSNPPILGKIPVTITITNKGNTHATNLKIEDQTRSSLLAGDVWTTFVNLSSTNLIKTNSFNIWSIAWDDGNDQKIGYSNSINLNYNMIGDKIPYFNIIRTITHTVYEGGNKFNETITITNNGNQILEQLSIKEQKPEKIQFLNGNFSLNGNILEASSENIETRSSVIYQYTASIMDVQENYVLLPPQIVIRSSGLQIIRLAQSVVLPLGVYVSKNFETTNDFIGANISIDINVLNTGSIPIFTASLIVGEDTFSETFEGDTNYYVDTLNQGEHLGSINKVKLLGTGNFESVEATALFIIAGEPFMKNSDVTKIRVYPTIFTELTVNPINQIEGQEFTIVLTIKNPSEIDVTNVNVNLDIPSEIRIIEGSLELIGENLNANSDIIKTAKVIVDSSNIVSVEKPNVEFQYGDKILKGTSNSLVISINDNIQTRYGLPILIAIFLMLVTAFISRKLVYTNK